MNNIHKPHMPQAIGKAIAAATQPVDPFFNPREPAPMNIGATSVLVDKFLAEGGYARVYVGHRMNDNMPLAIKRIIVPSEAEAVQLVKKEIDFMASFNHKNIVQFIDTATSRVSGGGVQFLICMEFCGGGQLVDIMNKRMAHRFQEAEVLRIFSDVCEAVAYLHYHNPPIIHRDIKVENILLSSQMVFKLCDFGSCTTTRVSPGQNLKPAEISAIQEEIDKQTTLQYRAPEMCDLYRRRGLTEKTDLWALGVLLYKICYYTTPFEVDGKLAILNNRYEIPENPPYSKDTQMLIRRLLADHPSQRPNIFQLTDRVFFLRKQPCPIQNIYPPEPAVQQEQPEQQQAHAPVTIDAPSAAPNVSPPSNQRRGRANRTSGKQGGIVDAFTAPAVDVNIPATAFASSDDPFAKAADSIPAAGAVQFAGSNDDPFAIVVQQSAPHAIVVSSDNLSAAYDGRLETTSQTPQNVVDPFYMPDSSTAIPAVASDTSVPSSDTFDLLTQSSQPSLQRPATKLDEILFASLPAITEPISRRVATPDQDLLAEIPGEMEQLSIGRSLQASRIGSARTSNPKTPMSEFGVESLIDGYLNSKSTNASSQVVSIAPSPITSGPLSDISDLNFSMAPMVPSPQAAYAKSSNPGSGRTSLSSLSMPPALPPKDYGGANSNAAYFYANQHSMARQSNQGGPMSGMAMPTKPIPAMISTTPAYATPVKKDDKPVAGGWSSGMNSNQKFKDTKKPDPFAGLAPLQTKK